MALGCYSWSSPVLTIAVLLFLLGFCIVLALCDPSSTARVVRVVTIRPPHFLHTQLDRWFQEAENSLIRKLGGADIAPTSPRQGQELPDASSSASSVIHQLAPNRLRSRQKGAHAIDDHGPSSTPEPKRRSHQITPATEIPTQPSSTARLRSWQLTSLVIPKPRRIDHAEKGEPIRAQTSLDQEIPDNTSPSSSSDVSQAATTQTSNHVDRATPISSGRAGNSENESDTFARPSGTSTAEPRRRSKRLMAKAQKHDEMKDGGNMTDKKRR